MQRKGRYCSEQRDTAATQVFALTLLWLQEQDMLCTDQSHISEGRIYSTAWMLEEYNAGRAVFFYPCKCGEFAPEWIGTSNLKYNRFLQ